jgi:proline iminopeptidase
VTKPCCLLAAVLVLAGAGCRDDSLPPREGYIPVAGGRIWYQVVGEGTGTPLLLVHGGPGGTSCGMTPLKALGDERRVIFYDQLGTGRSDRTTDSTLWETHRFLDEIDSIRSHLKLDRLHLYGRSWGGSVVAEYLITRQPQGIVSAVLASPLISTSQWIADADTLRMELPAELQRVLVQHESAGTFDAPEYLAATDSFYARFMSRKQPPVRFPECEGVTGNDTIYRYMWGPTEFVATGNLKTFERAERLREITVPVLFITGEFDEARPPTVRGFHQQVSGSEFEMIEGSGHSLEKDNPEQVLRVLRTWLRGVDKDLRTED